MLTWCVDESTVQKVPVNEYSTRNWFFRKNLYQLQTTNIILASKSNRPHRLYMVRLTIFNLRLVPSTKPLDSGEDTAFATVSKSFFSSATKFQYRKHVKQKSPKKDEKPGKNTCKPFRAVIYSVMKGIKRVRETGNGIFTIEKTK